MPDTSLAKKLVIKPHYRILLLNAPRGYRELMGELPDGVTITTEGDGSFDMVQAFAGQRDDLAAVAPQAIQAVKPDGLLWFSYPKKTGKIASDLSREVTWEVIAPLGWRPVTQISIDETWSALRFKPGEMRG